MHICAPWDGDGGVEKDPPAVAGGASMNQRLEFAGGGGGEGGRGTVGKGRDKQKMLRV